MYKNYIFDLYGTLIDINTDEEKDELWEKVAILYRNKKAKYTATELKIAYHKFVEEEKVKVKKENPSFEYIDIKLENVFLKLFSAQNINVDKSYIKTVATSFRSYSTTYIKLYDGVIDLLKTLKNKGKKIYLLSNAQRIFTENELNMFNLMEFFDGVMISSDVCCSKPDRHFYKTLLEKYNLKKEETIMIGNDSVADIEGAKNVGIDALYIHQNISPDIKKPLKSDYTIMDGDVYSIKNLII